MLHLFGVPKGVPKRSHKKKVPDERQAKAAMNLGSAFVPPKRSHAKKGTAAYVRQTKRIALSSALHGQKPIGTPPKRSHKKKVTATANAWIDTEASFVDNAWKALGIPAIPGVQAIGVRLPVAAKPNPNFPQTATTFFQQMEPGIHMVLQAILSKAFTSKHPDKEERRRVTRRLYRAAVMSATSFFMKSSPDLPSDRLLRDQGIQAVNKAVNKAKKTLPSSFTDFDID